MTLRLRVAQAHRESRSPMRKMLHRSAAQDRALQKTKRLRLRILISSLVTDADVNLWTLMHRSQRDELRHPTTNDAGAVTLLATRIKAQVIWQMH